MRARVQFNAKINDKTDAVVRMTTDSIEFGNTYDDNTGESTGAAYIDRAYVDHRFGKHVSAKVGRFNQVIGNGYFYDDAFDGAQINIGNDKNSIPRGPWLFLKRNVYQYLRRYE